MEVQGSRYTKDVGTFKKHGALKKHGHLQHAFNLVLQGLGTDVEKTGFSCQIESKWCVFIYCKEIPYSMYSHLVRHLYWNEGSIEMALHRNSDLMSK